MNSKVGSRETRDKSLISEWGEAMAIQSIRRPLIDWKQKKWKEIEKAELKNVRISS